MRESGGWDNWTMVLVEKYPCADGLEARKREHYWYEILKAGMNTRRPYRAEEELIEYKKQYRETNKDKAKIYREAHKDKMKIYNKEYHKLHYEANSEHRKIKSLSSRI